jgi:hypothetical protein
MKKLSIVCLLAAAIGLPGQVLASPVFSLDTFVEWNTAVEPVDPNDTTVKPVTEWYPALDAYGTEGIDYVYVTPTITAMTAGTSGEPDDGLLMTWGDGGADPDIPQVAAWEYTYPIDPDLTGKTLNLNVTPPTGILAVSLTLNDVFGGWRSWTWTVAPTLLSNVPNSISIDPTLAGLQAGSATFMESVGPLFDVTTVVSIQADELAVGSSGWNTFPSGPPTTGTMPWNYWSALQVVPEPTTMALSLLTLGGLSLVQRRRA